MPAPPEFLKFIDDNAESFIQRLAEAVAIPSVSGDPKHRDDVFKMAHWLDAQLKSYGVETKLVDLGKHIMDGQELPLPPAVLGKIGNDINKKTVLIYGHFDVQPAHFSDGWATEPFKLTAGPNGQLFGRGSTDDKGPVLGWLNVLQWHSENNKELPVNIKFCFEGMEESGSNGLDELAEREVKKGGWFEDVDCVCITDTNWLNTRTPVLTYGLRGISYFKITVSGPAWDVHSGMFGRTIHEPMTDLVMLMSKLVDGKGNILIPGIEDMVPSLLPEEQAIYERIDYAVEDIETSVGAKITLSTNKADVLMGRMRLPALSLHGIEGGAVAKTVIPAKVTGSFSLRLVPPQTPDNIRPLVTSYLESEFAKSGSKNTMSIENNPGGKPWAADIYHWNHEAAKEAMRQVYGVEPDMVRDGGSIPIALTFAEATDTNVVLVPMGRGDDAAHSTNEKLDTSNFIQGSKLFGAYLYELGAIARK